MSKLFEIKYTGGQSSQTLDVTPFIVLSSYAVSSQADGSTWTDGNNHERRLVKRRRLKGSFSVKFFDRLDYVNFLEAIEGSRNEGYDYSTADVYDNKTRTVKSNALVYIDYEPSNEEPTAGWDFTEEIEITITER